MKKIIHHLRKQSEENKRRILHATTLVCGTVLVILWVYSLGATVSNSDAQLKINRTLQPLNVLKDNIPPLW